MIKIKKNKKTYLECQSCSDLATMVVSITDSVLEENEYGIESPSQSFRFCDDCAGMLSEKVVEFLEENL